METRAHHVLIGLFTVTLAGAALWFALWLGRPATGDAVNLFDIYFQESVSGLSVGSAVRYSGIQVGSVERLRLDPEDPRRVQVRVRLGADTPIKHDTRAQLLLANITGAYEIQLSGGSPESPPLRPEGDQVPVIPAQPSPLAQIAGGGEQLMQSITQLIGRGNQLLSPENTANIGAVLADLSSISGAIAEQSDDIGRAVAALSETSVLAQRAVADTAQLVSRANGMLDEQGEQVLGSAVQAMAALERSSGELERILSENESALTSSITGLSTIGPALHELRSTLAALGGIARRLEEDPARFLLGRDNVTEFNP